MYKGQKLTELLIRNDDWLVSRFLIKTNDYSESERGALINHSWRQTTENFNKLLKVYLKKQNSSQGKKAYCSTEFQNFASIEVEMCNKRNIAPHIYISFIKSIRPIYKQLIFEGNYSPPDKKEYWQIIQNCFENIEISFTQNWWQLSRTNQENVKRVKSERMFPSMYNNFPNALVVVDNKLNIISLNTKAKKLFNKSVEEKPKSNLAANKLPQGFILTTRIKEFCSSNDISRSMDEYIQNGAGKLFSRITMQKIAKTKNILITIINLSKWMDEIEILTNEKNKALEASQLKTLFLANISHEIRTPMNAIVGFSELLSLHKTNPKDKKEYLSMMKKSSGDLLTIIEDVIDIAKIDSHQVKLHPRETKPAEIATDLATVYREHLKTLDKSDVTIKTNIPDTEKNLVLRTDPRRLKQVLSNLLGNACKFTDKGTIELGYKLAENKLVYFYVKDTGTGIPYDLQSKVFNQFIQEDKLYEKNKNGSGLGLSISKSFVNLMGGKIWVSSVPKKGTNFYFYLPYIKPREQNDIQLKKAISKAQPVDLSNLNVLVTEDDKAAYIILRETLKPTGVKLTHVSTGEEAITFLENNANINLVLMDIKMNGINGIETTKQIKELNPKLPVIALTAYSLENERAECLNAGCIDFIPKPFNANDLLKSIIKHTEEYKPLLIKS